MDEIEKIVQQLLGKDNSLIAGAVQKLLAPVYQDIFNKGHGVATAKAQGDRVELEANTNRLNGELVTAAAKIKELEESKPDVAKVRKQYDESIDVLKNEHKTQVQKLQTTITAEREARALADIRSGLQSLGVDADYADVLASKDDVKRRLKFKDDGSVEVLQAGKDIPIIASGDKKPVALLVDELRTTVPAKFVTSNGDRGSGTSGAGGASADTTSKTWAQGIRDTATAERAAKKPSGSASDRLRGKSKTA